jgi:hypothetical protein
LPVAPRRPSLEDLLPLLVAATVFAFACGSSSVTAVNRAGHSARWAVLAVLLGAAALARLRRGTVPRLTPAVRAAAALVGLALVSASWSIEPRLTIERAVSLGLLFLTCVLLASPERASRLLAAVLAGGVAVALAGLLVLVLDHGRAVQPATYQGPARYQGFGQDPNTGALLLAVVLPIALWMLLEAQTLHRRISALGALGLLAGTIVASGSRGGLLAAGIGALVVVTTHAGRSRRALVGAAGVVVAVALGTAITTLPKAGPLTTAPSSTQAAAPKSSPKPAPKPHPPYHDAGAEYPLDADVGLPLPGGGQPTVKRSLLGSSGRLDAWEGALHDVARRPITGHGFGTEREVFVDRYYRFAGGLPENSYIGLGIQLGLAGLIALAGVVAALVRPGLRALRGPRRGLAGAALGVLGAGLAIAVVQSYIYSVGNLAAAALWIPAFLLPAVADA